MEGPNELASGFGIAVFEAPSPDVYLLVVSADFGYSEDTGTYAVRMSRVEDDHPNTFSNPTVAGVGQTIAGEIGYREDEDTFRVEVEQGRIYIVQMDEGGDEGLYRYIRGHLDPFLSRTGDGILLYRERFYNSYFHVTVKGRRGDAGEYTKAHTA